MSQIFISYSSKDHDFSELTKMKLQAQGLDVWMDQGELAPGEEWRNAIDKGISSSEVLLVILTPESCTSPYVTYEWAYAIGKGKGVIPILRQDADVHPRLEVFQYIDFRDSRAYPWSGLVKRINEYCQNAATDKKPTSVGQLSIEQLQNIIHSTVSLATAQSKSGEKQSDEQRITNATRSVIGAISSPVQSVSRTTKPRILWVDDRPDNNTHERAALESMGYAFSLALNTEEALEAISNSSYSAIISDMGRREGPQEGYVLLEKLRQSGNKIPYFIYAGSNAKQHKDEAIKKGAQGSTNSPSELFELITSSV